MSLFTGISEVSSWSGVKSFVEALGQDHKHIISIGHTGEAKKIFSNNKLYILCLYTDCNVLKKLKLQRKISLAAHHYMTMQLCRTAHNFEAIIDTNK